MSRLTRLLSSPPPAIGPVLVRLLSLAVAVSAVYYFVWRWDVTNWRAWAVALPLLGAELLGVLHILGFHQTVWPRRARPLTPQEDPTRRPLFILIPTVNEGTGILEPTVRGAQAARARFLEQFPHAQVTIALCNDGRVAGVPGWQNVERLADKLGVLCVTRTVGGGAKAGNIEWARQTLGATSDALIVIFDADMIARPEFLLCTVPLFCDRAIGWVQTGQYYHNLDNPVARWANDQQALFFGPICVGKAAQNAAFICGTNFVVRAAALDEIGGLPQDSITEDFAASILLHPRWRSLYLTDVLATGLGPLDLPSYFTQQQRWATGTFRVLKERWRMIVLPGGGLRPAQRVQYALSCTHYLSGLSNVLYLLAPLVYLYGGVSAVKPITLGALAWHFVPFWLLSQMAFWALAGGRTHLRGSVIGFASFPVLLTSLALALGGQRVRFVVTAKTRRARHPGRALVPHVVALLCCLGALGMAAHAAGHALALVWICAAWVLRSCLMLCALLWLGIASGRRDSRQPAQAARQPLRNVRKTLLWLLAGALLCAPLDASLRAQTPAPAVSPAAPPAGLPGWALTFDDEFNGPAVDTSKWTVTNEASQINGELEYYLPDDVSVQDGFLRIKSERRDFGDRHYTSGEVRSIHKFAQRYGRFEFRARLANTPGSWSAAYLLPESDAWPPEIDVLEYLGRQPDTIHMTVHSIDADGRHIGDHGDWTDAAANWSGQWHSYTVEWEPGLINYFIDGTLRRTLTNGVPDEPMYLRLNTAIGGWGESPDTGTWPQIYDIDYVRVYCRTDQPPPVSAGPDQMVTLPRSVTRLSGFTADGVKARWTKASGLGDVEFGDPQAASTFAQFSRAGTYTLRLTAADGKASASDEMRVFVNPRAAVVLTPAADTEADQGRSRLKWMADDYGYDPRLTVLNHVPEEPGRAPFHSQIYMKFDISALAFPVGAARLRLYGGLHHAGTKDGMTCGLYAVADTTWAETGMTWATRPAQGLQIGTLQVPPALFAVHDQWLEVDLTSYVQAQQKAGAKTLALTIASVDASDGNAFTFSSRDSDTNKPTLVVTLPPAH